MSGTIWGNFQLRRTLLTSFFLFGPVGCLTSGTDYFSGFHVPVCLFSGEFYFSVYEMPNFSPSSVSSKSFKFSYMYSCMASTDMWLLRIFYSARNLSCIFLWVTKVLTLGVLRLWRFQIRNSFRLLIFFSRRLPLIPHFPFLYRKNQPDFVVHFFPVGSVVWKGCTTCSVGARFFPLLFLSAPWVHLD